MRPYRRRGCESTGPSPIVPPAPLAFTSKPAAPSSGQGSRNVTRISETTREAAFVATTLPALVNANANAAPVSTADASTFENTLTNVADTDRDKDAKTDATPGLEAPLQFQCGVPGERTVLGWETRPTTP